MTPVLDPAEFDRRIAVMRSVKVMDEAGKPMPNGEAVVVEAWAKYVPVSDRERLTHKHQALLSARFTVRWSAAAAGVLSSDVIVFEGQRFGVNGVKEIGRRQYLEITAGGHEA